MESRLIELEQRRKEIRSELKTLTSSERDRRHQLLDEYHETDTMMMIARAKIGESECESCGKWRKLVILNLHGKEYDVCEACKKLEEEV